MTWSTRPALAPGQYPRGDELEQILDQIDSLTDPGLGAGWTDYSASLAWTASGVAPALNNAVVVAKWRQPAGSDIVQVRIRITFGNTSTFGTGTYFWSLPVAPHADEIGGPVGVAYALDAGVQEYGGVAKAETTTTFRVHTSAGGSWANNGPFVWGNTDAFGARMQYQVA